MKKIFSIIALHFLFLTGLVSAQYYGNYYNRFSLGNFFSSLDSQTVSIMIVFIICFGFISFALSKYFKDNKAIAHVISAAVAFGVAWYMNRYGFSIDFLFYNLGFSPDFLSTILPLLFLAGIGFGVYKLKSTFLILMGIVLMALPFTGIIYEIGWIFIIGVLCLAGGIWWKKSESGVPQRNSQYSPAYAG